MKSSEIDKKKEVKIVHGKILCSKTCISNRYILKLQKDLLNLAMVWSVQDSETNVLEEKHCLPRKSHISQLKINWYPLCASML